MAGQNTALLKTLGKIALLKERLVNRVVDKKEERKEV